LIGAAQGKPEVTLREFAWHVAGNHGAFISQTGIYGFSRDYGLATNLVKYDLIIYWINCDWPQKKYQDILCCFSLPEKFSNYRSGM